MALDTSVMADEAARTDFGQTGASESQGPTCECQHVNVLLVVDRSPSMTLIEPDLTAALTEAATALAETFAGLCSFRFGVTTASSVGQNPGTQCQGLGSLVVADCLPKRPFLTQEDNFVRGLTCILGAEFDPGSEVANSRPIDATLAALSRDANGPGGCNEGFFSPGQSLVVFVVTNADDDLKASKLEYGSQGDPADWITSLIAAVDGQLETVSLALVAGVEPTPGCSATYASNLLDFSHRLPPKQVVTFDICSNVDKMQEFLTNALPNSIEVVCSG